MSKYKLRLRFKAVLRCQDFVISSAMITCNQPSRCVFVAKVIETNTVSLSLGKCNGYIPNIYFVTKATFLLFEEFPDFYSTCYEIIM